MTSKKLGSILGSVPPATASGNKNSFSNLTENNFPKNKLTTIEYTRIVATIPQELKDEIKRYIKTNKGETETTVVLKALKKMGFNVDSSWLVDKRSLR